MRKIAGAIGAVIVVLGAWAAIVAYAGPAFGYPMPPGSEKPAWLWTESHWVRHLAPGLAAMLGGAILSIFRRTSGTRMLAVAGGVLSFLAGAWIILGREIADLWVEGGGFPPGENVAGWEFLVTRFGYHDGTGLVIAALAAFALGVLAVGRERAVEEPGDADRPLFREQAPARERELVR